MAITENDIDLDKLFSMIGQYTSDYSTLKSLASDVQNAQDDRRRCNRAYQAAQTDAENYRRRHGNDDTYLMGKVNGTKRELDHALRTLDDLTGRRKSAARSAGIGNGLLRGIRKELQKNGIKLTALEQF